MQVRQLLALALRLFVAASLLPACIGLAQGRPGFKLLHSFGGNGDGNAPSSGVVPDTKGNLYGMTSVGGTLGYGTVYELSPQKNGMWTETILHNFPPPQPMQDGSEPSGGVAIDSLGNLYGTTTWGGSNNCGTIFELTPTHNGWVESILYNFCSLEDGNDGFHPVSAPILDPAGNLYGGTNSGFGQGVIYELTPSASGWEESILYTFCSQPKCSDGELPGQVVRDREGNLYGPTEQGGSEFGYCPLGCGVVFVLNPPNLAGGWTETVLHAFQGGTDGITPNGVSFYGDKIFGTTSLGGGSQDCTIGCGTVFSLAPGQNRGEPQEEVLYAFSNFSGGQNPGGAPVFDKAGNMYGVAGFGGAPCGCGLVWELKRVTGGWQYKILHEFTGGDGVLPLGSLIIDSDGNLYGTTNGGSTGGVVFEILAIRPTAK